MASALPLMTPEQLFLQIGADFIDLSIEANTKLILALEKEDYETATQQRDFLKALVFQTVDMSLMVADIEEEILVKNYQEQNELIFTRLKETYEGN